MMPLCWNCSADVPEQAAFCPNCGKTFATTTPGAPPAAQTSARPSANPYPSYPGDVYGSSPDGRLERKVDNLRRLLLWVLVLQVVFIILVFA